jgi:hypothetical protein
MPWPRDPPAHPSASQSTTSGEGALLGWGHLEGATGALVGNPRTGRDALQIDSSRRSLTTIPRDFGSTLPAAASARIVNRCRRRPQCSLATGPEKLTPRAVAEAASCGCTGRRWLLADAVCNGAAVRSSLLGTRSSGCAACRYAIDRRRLRHTRAAPRTRQSNSVPRPQCCRRRARA